VARFLEDARRRLVALAVVAAGAALVPAGAAEAKTTQLSNERTLSYWATANDKAPITSEPRSGARRIARLRLWTEYRQAEVYLVLREHVDTRGREWLEVRIPMRPNGRTGWVPRDSLGPLQATTLQLVIDRRKLRATLFRRGRAIWSARIGVGARRTPTPAGRYYIRERLQSLRGGVYGPVAFGTSAYSGLSDWPKGGVIGIHGTNQPGLIPGRPSHGCIRFRNGDILRLWRLAGVGTPVLIR
jgi:lipoprotein-anchoring transpeptidase ErfK/SrfK